MPGIPDRKEEPVLPADARARQKLLCDVMFGACSASDFELAAGAELGGYSLCVLEAAGGSGRQASAAEMLSALSGLGACRGAEAFAVAPGRVAVYAQRSWQVGSRPGCGELRDAVARALGAGFELETAEGFGCEELCADYARIDGILNERLRRPRAAQEEQAAPAPAGRNVKPMLSKALDYIGKHYHEPITLQDVAEHAYASPFYISRLFKKELGVSFVDYLGKLRVENAGRLLCETRLRILEVSERVGIQDAHYFAKLFKKHAGMSPTEYRAENKP